MLIGKSSAIVYPSIGKEKLLVCFPNLFKTDKNEQVVSASLIAESSNEDEENDENIEEQGAIDNENSETASGDSQNNPNNDAES